MFGQASQPIQQMAQPNIGGQKLSGFGSAFVQPAQAP